MPRLVTNPDSGHFPSTSIKGCTVKNWTTFKGYYFNEDMKQFKKQLIFTNSVAMRKSFAICNAVKVHFRRHVWLWSRGPEIRFVTARHQCLWPPSGLFFFSWSMFDASQLPAYTACFRLPVKHSTGCSWGTFGGVEVFEPSHTLCSWRNSNHLLPLFQGWRGCMDLLSLVECYAILPEGVSVADSRSTTCSWILNQASCSWPPSGDLTRHLRACTAGLGQIVPDLAFFFVVSKFLSSNDWRTWINSAFCKTPLFTKHTSDRLSLLFISKVKIYNPLFCSLADFGLPFMPCASQSCHFRTQCCYSCRLFKETNRIADKNSFFGNLPM